MLIFYHKINYLQGFNPENHLIEEFRHKFKSGIENYRQITQNLIDKVVFSE